MPDFIIVGAMKCGTTVLWRNLDVHSEVSMGKNWDDPKKTSTEIRFFNNGGPHHTWEKKGSKWYVNLFSGECCGEKSANYIESRVAFERMKSLAPDVKLILCVRNPVDRCYSEYQMQRHTAPRKHTKGFDKAIARDKGYRKRGRYFEMIRDNVLPYFPKEQLYVVVQEWMYQNVPREINKVCSYLGVGPAEMDVAVIPAEKRDSTLETYRKWRTKYKPMNLKTRDKLVDYYRQHNEDLFNFIGFDIPEWNQ